MDVFMSKIQNYLIGGNYKYIKLPLSLTISLILLFLHANTGNDFYKYLGIIPCIYYAAIFIIVILYEIGKLYIYKPIIWLINKFK